MLICLENIGDSKISLKGEAFQGKIVKHYIDPQVSVIAACIIIISAPSKDYKFISFNYIFT